MFTRILFFLTVTVSLLYSTETKKFHPDSLTANSVNIRPIKQDYWIAEDKGLHLAGSFIISGLTTSALKRFSGYKKQAGANIGLSFTFSLGLSKEICDSRKKENIFSYKDLTADLVGCLLGYIVFK